MKKRMVKITIALLQCTSSLAFPKHPVVSVVERQQAWYFGVLLHLNKLLCSAVVFRLLHQK